jgi:tRNA/rRNA methyltransferase
VVIPTVPTATSLNLAQAVMVLCYEVLLARYHPTAPPVPTLATVADVEAMYTHLRQAFTIRGFPDAYSVERILDRLRRIFDRTGLEQRDIRLIRGIARQLAWALRHPAAQRHEQEPYDPG